MAFEQRIITVFGSSRPREGDADYALSHELGQALAAKGFVVCTGGYGGVMEAASRGAKDAGGRTLAITTRFFPADANRWVDEEIRIDTWEGRLFELVHRGHGYAACKGGTSTLAELAVVWEMINKHVLEPRPFVLLGDSWQPIIERVREVEAPDRPSSEVVDSSWREANDRLLHIVSTPVAAANYLARRLVPTPQT